MLNCIAQTYIHTYTLATIFRWTCS